MFQNIASLNWLRPARAAPPMPERRRSIRLTTIFQVAKLVAPGIEELCILRDISPDGLKAEIYLPVAVGESVRIEFRTGHEVRGHVAWASEGGIGIAFDAAVSVVTLLSHSSFDDRLGRVRPPRLDMAVEASLRTLEGDIAVRTCDVSQAGVKLLVDRALPAELPCELALPALGHRAAVVRWYRGGSAGLMFVDPLSYPDFASWRQALARANAARQTTA